MKKSLLVWDGDCGFCQASVRRIMRRKGVTDWLEDVPRQRASQLTEDIRAQAGGEIVVLEPDGTKRGGADAVLYVFQRSGSWWAGPFRVPPLIWPSRIVYRLIARNRGWISQRFFGGESCALPGAVKSPGTVSEEHEPSH